MITKNLFGTNSLTPRALTKNNPRIVLKNRVEGEFRRQQLAVLFRLPNGCRRTDVYLSRRIDPPIDIAKPAYNRNRSCQPKLRLKCPVSCATRFFTTNRGVCLLFKVPDSSSLSYCRR